MIQIFMDEVERRGSSGSLSVLRRLQPQSEVCLLDLKSIRMMNGRVRVEVEVEVVGGGCMWRGEGAHSNAVTSSKRAGC